MRNISGIQRQERGMKRINVIPRHNWQEVREHFFSCKDCEAMLEEMKDRTIYTPGDGSCDE
jgi:transcription initiation factor IIE alpha subunit